MRVKAWIFAVFAAAFLMPLCGCDLFATDTNELLHPPALTGDTAPIEKALGDGVRGEYTLRYPSGGDRRSAIVLNDVDGDGTAEAFVFYSTAEDDMHLHVIRRNGKDWQSDGDQRITAGGVERIDFCDLDGDGIQEVLVGWEIHGQTEKQLAVYGLGAAGPEQYSLRRYSDFLTCDLDGDTIDEVFLQLLSPTDSENRAVLLKMSDGKVSELSSCAMDRTVKAVTSLTAAELSTGQMAVYADELKTAGAVTEVLFFSRGGLVNPLLDSTSGENTRTERAASLVCRDVNRDGLLEIPVAEELPSAAGPESAEKVYYTRWSSFNGETLAVQQTVIINQSDGYSISVPEKWIGRISILRDTERRVRGLYTLPGAPGEAPIRLAELRALDADEWKNTAEQLPVWTQLLRNGGEVIIGRVTETENALAVTTDELRSMLFLNE